MRVVNFLPELVSNYTKEAFLFLAMKTHDEFLQFNNVELIVIEKNGVDYIALKPILDALGIAADSTLKRTKRDRFLGGYTSILDVQVGEIGKKQRRNMICLPEKYIYGWIGHLNGDTPEISAYKETCYELLYNHFKGTITNRKKILLEKKSVETRIREIKNILINDDPIQKELLSLEIQKKQLNSQLDKIDKNLIADSELFPEK